LRFLHVGSLEWMHVSDTRDTNIRTLLNLQKQGRGLIVRRERRFGKSLLSGFKVDAAILNVEGDRRNNSVLPPFDN